MATPAEHCAAILIAETIGAASGDTWPIKIGRFVDKPDAQINLVDTPGRNPNPAYLLDFPTVMARVRDPKDDYATGYAKAKAVKDVLLGCPAQTMVGGDRIDGITMLSDLSLFGWDENSRPLFSINFQLYFEPATNANTNRVPL